MLSKVLGKAWVRDLLLGAALLCATLSLMLWPQESMEAARDGLRLCYNVIIPSLFPFFVLSTLVVDLGLAGYLGRLLEPVMRPLFRVSGSCASAFALGFVGGYPVGAKTAISLYQNGLCTKTEAERLLAFCNNSGPAFILGVVGAGIFSSGRAGLLLYLTHAAASVCVGLLFRFYKRGEQGGVGQGSAPRFHTARVSVALTDAVKSAFSATLNICAFVIFFTVTIRMLLCSGALSGAAALLGRLLLPLGLSAEWVQHLLIGLIELTSGVRSLSGSGALAGRLSLAAFMLGWAGVSVHCQVLSFVGGSGLSPRTYFIGKLLHGGLSALLTGLLTRFFFPDLAVSAYLAEQVDSIAAMDFERALSISTAVAWVVWLAFFAVAVVAIRKSSGNGRRAML